MPNYRHGDVSLHQITELPKELKKQKHNGSFAIALGETTGHKHSVVIDRPQDMSIYLDEATGLFVLDLKSEAKITHEEHRTIILEPGIYIQKQEQEYDPFEEVLKQVKD